MAQFSLRCIPHANLEGDARRPIRARNLRALTTKSSALLLAMLVSQNADAATAILNPTGGSTAGKSVRESKAVST
jgi:hypothetical protein